MKNYGMKNLFPLWVIALPILTMVMVGAISAQSLYLVSEHDQSLFDAWNINPDGTATQQATYTLQHSTEPAGIAVDGDSQTIFITGENNGGVELVDAVTLTYIGASSGPVDLAGIDVDDAANIIYTVQRWSDYLYVYDWDPTNVPSLNEVNESENNDTFSNRNIFASQGHLIINGSLSPTGDRDILEISGLGSAPIDIEVVSGDFDSILGLFDASGNLTDRDDDGGSGWLSRFSNVTPDNGTVRIGITGYHDYHFTGNHSWTGTYQIVVGPIPGVLILRPGYPINLPNCEGAFGIALDETRDILWVADTALGATGAPPPNEPQVTESEDNTTFPARNTFDSTGQIVINGALEELGDRDIFEVTGLGTGPVDIEVVSGEFDSILGLFDASGNLIEYDDDSGSGYQLSRFTGVMPDNGTVRFGITGSPDVPFIGFHSQTGSYQIAVWPPGTLRGVVRGYDISDLNNVTEDANLSFAPSHAPVDVTVDRLRNLVYTVSMSHDVTVPPEAGSNLLSKYDITTQTETTVDLGHQGIGVTVDEITGFVYVTGGQGAQNLEVWDTSITPWTQVQATGNIGTPAGIAIGNISWNPLKLEKNDIVVGEVYIGSTFTYEITCDNELDPNYDAENVTITDELPPGIDFVSATQGGVYDPCTNIVFWDIGTIPAGGTGPLIELVVKVNLDAIPGSTIYNYCTIEAAIGGQQLPPTTVVDDQGSDDPNDELGTPVSDIVIWGVTYDGDTLLSTEGAPTVNANLIATLWDHEGNLLELDDEEVTFTLTAEGIGTIVATALSEDGVAHAFEALEPGLYKIEVTLASSDYTASAALVVYNPEGGFATGGGWILPQDDELNTYPNQRANFGFNAKYKKGEPTGHIEFRYSDGYIDVKSSSIERLIITGGKLAQFKGWALVNGEEGNWFFVKAIDNGEPGTNDTFEIKVWAPGVSIEGEPTDRAGGVLQGGNIVVHTKK
ncbi:MAG: post-COAP-1 domain-containing protein [Planctomycetota bacterium]|jgi:uncharacterized repeat protein (TIGR01451 family)